MYLTETTANALYDNRLPVSVWGFTSNGDDTLLDVWEDSSTPLKEKALAEATRVIDTFVYDGFPTDTSQPNQFPRNGSNSIPQEVKDATLELALHLLKEALVHDHSNPWVQRGRYVNATRIESVIAEGRESVSFGSTRSYYAIIHPYLKRWLKGRYGSVAHV